MDTNKTEISQEAKDINHADTIVDGHIDYQSAEMKKALANTETSIRASLRSAFRLGAALEHIRNNRLYITAGYKSGDAYWSDKWEITRGRAAQLIFASQVFNLLHDNGVNATPVTESQTRPLMAVTKGSDVADKAQDIMDIWAGAVELAKDKNKGKLTAKLVQESIDLFLGNIQVQPEGAADPAHTQAPGAGTEPANGNEVTGDTDKPNGADREAELLERLRFANARIAALESKLAMERAAHKRTRNLSTGTGIPASKLAKDLFRAGYRAMARQHSPELGGDADTMNELSVLKSALGI